jgi:hypothetical protein
LKSSLARLCFTLATLTCLHTTAVHAAILVDGAQVLRSRPLTIGGVGINAHSPDFATNSNDINYQGDLKAAGMKLVRSLSYPDKRKPEHDLSYFDRNAKAIITAGAIPLSIQYIKPGLPYLTEDGSPGGTVESNLVFLVKHYMAPPFNLKTQYWEIGNEPNLTVDYKVPSPKEYSDIFNRCHDALVKAGVRENVVLAGPVVAYPYRWPQSDSYGTQIMDYFLSHSSQSVDVVTYHSYAGGLTTNTLLNVPHKLDNIESSSRPLTSTTNYGMAALLARMQQEKFGRPHVGVGVTEHNATSFQHEISSGLWNLALIHYYLYNPLGRITTAFVFDDYGRQQGGFGFYDTNKQKDYNYWALWIANQLHGSQVLAQTTTDNLNISGQPNLLVTATRDSDKLYLEVINRSDKPIQDHVEIKGASLASPATLSMMRDGVQPNTGQPTNLRERFDYQFPSLSAVVFQYSLATPILKRRAKPAKDLQLKRS